MIPLAGIALMILVGCYPNPEQPVISPADQALELDQAYQRGYRQGETYGAYEAYAASLRIVDSSTQGTYSKTTDRILNRLKDSMVAHEFWYDTE